MQPLVSIITPMFNSASTINDTIRSVLSQTYENWEMIVVDDCSTDGSPDLVEKCSLQDDRVKILRLDSNSGAAVARNAALDVAHGRFIAFLDSDDKWYASKLEKQVSFMMENEYGFVFSSYNVINHLGRVTSVRHAPMSASYSKLLGKNVIGCLTVILDTEIVGKPKMPNIRRRQDLALWLKIIKQHGPAYGIQDVLAEYSIGSGSLSSNKAVAAKYQWILYRDIECLSLVRSGYYFSIYFIKNFSSLLYHKLTRGFF